MYNIKSIFKKLNEESENEELCKIQELICYVCNEVINYGQSYIRDEELKVYCSDKCYLKQLNSKYY